MSAKLKTTEFWLSILAILLGALMGAGVIGDGTIYAKVGGWLVAALGSSGYTIARTLSKLNTDAAGKPGWKTSEFWKALAVAGLTWAQSHAVPAGSGIADVIGQLLTLLPVGTYMVSRGVAKGAIAEAAKAAAMFLLLGSIALSGCAGLQKVASSCGGVAKSAVDSLTQQAYDSATSQADAPSWATFASTTLLAQGEAAAICAAQAALAIIDGKLPASPSAPGGHDHIVFANAAVKPDPLIAAGHERLADFVDAHGSAHSHIVAEAGR
jgi:hypothetical protein